MEERHADVHERGAVMGVQRGGIRDWLDACANTADGVSIDGCGRGSHASGGHSGRGHMRRGAGEDDAAALEEGLDAGDWV